MLVPEILLLVARRRDVWLCLSTCLLLSSFFLAACSGPTGGSNGPGATSTPSYVALAKLHWCGKPLLIFRDEHAPVTVTPVNGTPTSTVTVGTTPTITATTTAGITPTITATPTASGPTTVTDWSQVEPNLGFTVYLPAALPPDTCLVSASGTFHDPIFGGSFNIGYLLADHSSVSLSEAPLRTKNINFQCNPTDNGATKTPGTANTSTPAATSSATQAAILLCTGARGNTNIVFSERGNVATLKQFFNALQANVHWVPAS